MLTNESGFSDFPVKFHAKVVVDFDKFGYFVICEICVIPICQLQRSILAKKQGRKAQHTLGGGGAFSKAKSFPEIYKSDTAKKLWTTFPKFFENM